METVPQKTYSEIRKVLGAALFGQQVSFAADADWQSVFSEMYQQGIAAMPCNLYDTLPLDEDTSVRWNDVIVNSYYYKHGLLLQLGEVSQAFNQNGFRWALLKGFSAAMYYPDPFMRTIGDTDILIDANQFDQAVELLLQMGFERIKPEKDTDETRHFMFEKNKYTLELHRYYTLNLNRKEYIEFNRIICDGLDRTEVHCAENVAFNTLPPFENGLVILEHIAHHLESGIGIRHVLDFVMYAETQFQDAALKERFTDYLKTSELKILAYTILKMGIKYFGIRNCPDIPTEITDAQCDALLGALQTQGDLGHKIGAMEDLNTVTVLVRTRGGIAGWWYYLQVAGEYNWALLKKHPRLKPFARFYQVGRYIRQGLSVKNPLKALIRSSRKSKKQKELLDTLGLSEHKR